MKDNFLIVGKIATAFGVKGWVKVVSFTDPVENIMSFTPWYLEDSNTKGKINWRIVEVEECRRHSDIFIAKLPESKDRDQALALKGKSIAILRSQLSSAEQNEFYWSDLEGLNVLNTEGVLLGTVSYLFATGANDVLVVKTEDKEIFIPFLLDQVIQKVDLVEKTIVVDWDFEGY